MNLNKIQTKNGTEDLLLSITKNCETLIKQAHTRAEETLRHWNLKWPNQVKHFVPNHLSRLKVLGC